jgi:rod shape-determining protein MreC
MNSEESLSGIRYASLQFVEKFADAKMQFSIWKDYQKEIEALKRENFLLSTKNQKLDHIIQENYRLKKLLGLKQKSEIKFVAANVIGIGTEIGIRSLILDVGEEDSINKNMPVVTAQGLVGKVVITTLGQSIAHILFDHNSLVSARLKNSRETGVISCDGNSWLNLLYISKDVPVSIGEEVTTSGLSEIYPPLIRIGVVTLIEENEFDLFKEIRVKPTVNFNTLEEVFVLITKNLVMPENLAGE